MTWLDELLTSLPRELTESVALGLAGAAVLGVMALLASIALKLDHVGAERDVSDERPR